MATLRYHMWFLMFYTGLFGITTGNKSTVSTVQSLTNTIKNGTTLKSVTSTTIKESTVQPLLFTAKKGSTVQSLSSNTKGSAATTEKELIVTPFTTKATKGSTKQILTTTTKIMNTVTKKGSTVQQLTITTTKGSTLQPPANTSTKASTMQPMINTTTRGSMVQSSISTTTNGIILLKSTNELAGAVIAILVMVIMLGFFFIMICIYREKLPCYKCPSRTTQMDPDPKNYSEMRDISTHVDTHSTEDTQTNPGDEANYSSGMNKQAHDNIFFPLGDSASNPLDEFPFSDDNFEPILDFDNPAFLIKDPSDPLYHDISTNQINQYATLKEDNDNVFYELDLE